MRLHLIRHGQTDWNRLRRVQGQLDSHLDEIGRNQARELGQRLADVPFVTLHVSSAARTRETADLLFEGRELPVEYHDDLREMNLGRWESRMWDDVEHAEPDLVRRYHAFDATLDIDGAEGFGELQRRGLSAIDRIVRQERAAGNQDRDIAIVSHGAILRSVLAHWLDLPLSRFNGQPGLPNCAHSIVHAISDRFRVETIADAPVEHGLWSELLDGSRRPR